MLITGLFLTSDAPGDNLLNDSLIAIGPNDPVHHPGNGTWTFTRLGTGPPMGPETTLWTPLLHQRLDSPVHDPMHVPDTRSR